MTVDSDFHNHVVRSSARQMAESAQAKGIRVLGLSEHVFQMSEVRPLLQHMPLEGPVLSLATYHNEVRSAARTVGLDVRLGLEVDFIPEQADRIQAALQGYDWDYLIGSVHQIDDNLFENVIPKTREEGEALWKRYMQLLRAAVRSGNFSVVSHPVRMRSQNPYLPATLDDDLAQLAADAAQQDVALEINGYDILFYPDVVQRLARACADQSTPISIGSDAHNPRQVAQAHAPTEQLLRSVGIGKVRIWKRRIAEEYTI